MIEFDMASNNATLEKSRIRDIVLSNINVFQDVEAILKQRALTTYKIKFGGVDCEEDDATLIGLGEKNIEDSIDELVMSEDELFERVLGPMKEKPMNESNFRHAIRAYTEMRMVKGDSHGHKYTNVKHNIVKIYEGICLKGYVYSEACSEALIMNSMRKETCMIDNCRERKKPYSRCRRKELDKY